MKVFSLIFKVFPVFLTYCSGTANVGTGLGDIPNPSIRVVAFILLFDPEVFNLKVRDVVHRDLELHARNRRNIKISKNFLNKKTQKSQKITKLH